MHILPFSFPGLPRIRCAFGTRLSGDVSLHGALPGSAQEQRALEARKRLLAEHELTVWTELHQVHGDTFVVDPQPTDISETAGTSPLLVNADGHATARKHHALCIKTADCQPIFLAHKAGYIAALHVGWRGNHCNFPGSGVAAFCEAYGLEPAELMAVRGPSLGPGAAEFVNFATEWSESFRPWFTPQTRSMDLWTLTKDQLVAAGLPANAIFSIDLCTRSTPQLFFSHRLKHSGRQASIIWME